ncbi:polysaccharide deacetylase [Niabella ginsenosidivorans]|uniref:Polysaccharide deacetylase n=1 Tax=Niabella ginsenosidivorans TaxID=1176587 RepID=A0A1A9I4W6_9BACT|nr:polysaccharide deacetylase family protein [Niabella ginsenosidivorans]ANH82365.1 polysaccharide deacetylase [Niabella ginsenosidivorans]
MYFVKTPWWLKKIYAAYNWDIPVSEKKIFLTFDDGPHPVATPFVLEQLKAYNAKATFFCIGKNVAAGQSIYQQILNEGHSVGNHTHNHLNGWKTKTAAYIDNVAEASKVIRSGLFRPPYGRISKEQGRLLRRVNGFRIIMWDVLSGDFDQQLPPEKCLGHVLQKTTSGSIIVFHDSQKALRNMQYALPEVLKHFSQSGFSFEAITELTFP